jgi:hypothetical protein
LATVSEAGKAAVIASRALAIAQEAAVAEPADGIFTEAAATILRQS